MSFSLNKKFNKFYILEQLKKEAEIMRKIITPP